MTKKPVFDYPLFAMGFRVFFRPGGIVGVGVHCFMESDVQWLAASRTLFPRQRLACP